jgi:hypothetical protein
MRSLRASQAKKVFAVESRGAQVVVATGWPARKRRYAAAVSGETAAKEEERPGSSKSQRRNHAISRAFWAIVWGASRRARRESRYRAIAR